MIDPITPGIEVYFRGKTWLMQLTLGALAGASGRLNIPILEGGPEALWAKPEAYRKGVLLYALVSRRFTDATLDECLDAVTDADHAVHYDKAIEAALEAVKPTIERLAEAYDKERNKAGARPLDGQSSGGDSGASESSISDSGQMNSGNSPLAS